METKKIKIGDILANEGQIEGLPRNPRKWERQDLEGLKSSIQETPELLEARGVLVTPWAGKYIALGGNMRLEAARELGIEEVTVHILPEETPLETMKEVVIKDNSSFGRWDYDALANEWDDNPLGEWGVNVWNRLEIEDESQDDGQVTPAEKTGNHNEKGRIIIVFKQEQSKEMAEMIGLEEITKVVYPLDEIYK